MTMQILVPLHTFPDGNSVNIARHAGAVARHLGAEVHALLLNADFPPISSPFADLLLDTAALIESSKARSRQNGTALIAEMRSEMERCKIDLRCTQTEYLPAELTDKVSDIARYHDLTMLGIGSHDDALRGTAEEVVFAAGRPILLVPEDLDAQGYHHVVIAWDGSRVAARAVGDAWPFVMKSSAVSIVCVTDEKVLPHADVGSRLADYFRRHELDATVSNIATDDRPIAETLQVHASNIGAGLLVMGGFGHSRMREFVLGGATNGILRDLRMPVLISH